MSLIRKLPIFMRNALPKGYTRIKGLTMNDNCYYAITDFRLTGADILRFSFSATTNCNVIGAYTTATAQTNYSLYVSTSSGSKYMRYNGGTYDSTISTDTRYDVVMKPTGTTGISTVTWTQKDFTCVSDLLVGTTSTGATSAKLKGSLYGNIEVEGRLKLVPCTRDSDSVVGYYDLYTHTFYAPIGTNPTVVS